MVNLFTDSKNKLKCRQNQHSLFVDTYKDDLFLNPVYLYSFMYFNESINTFL